MNIGEPEAGLLSHLSSPERELPAPLVSEEKLRELCAGDEDLEQLLDETLDLSVRYAASVARFDQIIGETQDDETALQRVNEARGRTHDALIGSMNALARNLNQRGRDGSWIKPISGDRVRYGKLAILLAMHALTKGV